MMPISLPHDDTTMTTAVSIVVAGIVFLTTAMGTAIEIMASS